jgi:hypothetical protein
MDPNSPYEVVQLDELDDWLRERFSWRDHESGWLYEGICPRCGHTTDKLFREEVIVSRFQSDRWPEGHMAAMRCNCTAAHDGREGGQGCGAWWGLEVREGDA